MQCEHVQRELIAHLHGEVTPQEHAAIEQHLSECEACAEEANAMKETGDLLSRGLKEWVDQGTCPPEVLERIQLSILPARPNRWRRWSMVVGSVAAVAVLLVVLVGQPQIAEQMASVPLLGALAAQLVDPDVEISIGSQQSVTAALFRPTRTVNLATAADEANQILTVRRVATDGQVMRIQYTVKGKDLLLPTEKEALIPEVSTQGGPITCQRLSADRRTDGIRFTLDCEAVAPGEEVTLTVPSLPREGAEPLPEMTATFTN